MSSSIFSLVMYDLFWVPLIIFTIFFIFFVSLNKQISSTLIQLNYKTSTLKNRVVFNKFNFSYKQYYYFILNLLFWCFLYVGLLFISSFYYCSSTVFFVFYLSEVSYFTYLYCWIFTMITINYLSKLYSIKYTNIYEHIVVISLIIVSLYYYIFVNSLISLIFVFEIQSILFIYLIATNYNVTVLFTDDIISSKVKNYSLSILWYYSSLIYQFWVSFLGSLLLIYSLLLLMKFNYILDWSNFDLFFLFSYYSQINLKFYFFIYNLLIVGFALKIGIFPFFFWKPEIYKNFSLSTLFFYMVIYLFCFINLFILLVSKYFILTINFWFFYLYVILYLTIIIVPIFIYSVFEIRVFLGYISVFHLIFIFFSAMLLNTSSLNISYFYLICYMFFTLNLFSIMFSTTTNSLWYLTDLQLFNSIPLVNTSILILFVSYAGLPPTLGFFSKLSLIFNFLVNNDFILFIIILISSFYIIYFYLQNYRFFGFSLSGYDYINNLVNYKLVLRFSGSYLFFIFWSLTSVFFYNDIFIFTNLVNFN